MMKFAVISTSLIFSACFSYRANTTELNFYDWPFGEEINKAHEILFEIEIGHEVNLHTIDYPLGENTEDAFLYDEPIDVVGMLSSSVFRLVQAGWIEDLSTFDEAVSAVDKMYPNVANAVIYDDRVYGIGQAFIGAAVPLIDMEQYAELGFTRQDFPTNWKTFNRQIVQIAESGKKGFYLPYWFNSSAGLPMGFMAEVLNRGGSIVDPHTLNVSMDSIKGPAFNTLVDWRRIMQSGAVDSQVLDMLHPTFDAAFMNNDYIFSTHKTDALLTAKERKKNGHKITLLPREGQSWGTIGAAHLGMSFRKGDTEKRKSAKLRLLIMATRGSEDLEFSVSRDWLINKGHFSAFKDYMESEEAQTIIRSKLHYPDDAAILMDLMANLPYPVGEWQVVWKHEFFDYMKKELQLYLRDPSVSPSTVIVKLNNKIEALRSSYGY